MIMTILFDYPWFVGSWFVCGLLAVIIGVFFVKESTRVRDIPEWLLVFCIGFVGLVIALWCLVDENIDKNGDKVIWKNKK